MSDGPDALDRTSRRVLMVCLSASFLPGFSASATTVALPEIGRDLELDAVMLAWITTSYLLAATIVMLPAGRLGDIFGRKLLFNGGLALFTVASLFCGLAPSAPPLIWARITQGIGVGMFQSATIALLTAASPTSARGRMLGMNAASVFAGLSLGPVAGGFLTGTVGWRSTFLVVPAVSVATMIAAKKTLHLVKETPSRERFDWRGAVGYGTIVSALIYGLSNLPAVGGIVLMSGAIIAVVPFVKLEARITHPLLHAELFRNRMFAGSSLAALFFFTTTVSVPFVLSLYLQFIRGVSPETTGLILLAQPVVQAAASPFAGRLSDHFEPRLLASAGMVLTFIGLVALMVLDRTTPVGAIVAVLSFLGIARALFSSPNANALMSSVSARHYGVASGTMGTMRVAGQMVGIGIVTSILGVAVGRSTMDSSIYGSFLATIRLSFMVLGVISLAGALVSLARGSIRHPPSVLP